jgi:UDP-N-acetylglucosamine--N-acetylmuramyl-(pentapeptide) pyrophosphoryl-undecaprenol N-acetylglucosamine transferase
VVVITGGSQGSLAINRVVAEWIGQGGAAGCQVVWATGRGSHAEFTGLDAPAVRVLPFIDPMADAWAVADLALCRGGMMTLSELAAWGIPAVIVPLPTAAANHQMHNARAAAAAGAALCLPQHELTAGRLTEEIGRLLADPGRRAGMADAALRRGHPDAARSIAGRVIELVARCGKPA